MAIIVKIRRCSSKMRLISRYLVRYMIKIILRKKIAILRNTEMIELILCFTTSVSLEAFNLGYFRFIISPSTAWNVIVTNDVKIIRIVSVMIWLNFMKKIISLNIMNGSSIMNGNIIFDFIIVDVFIGRLFVILIVFPSSDIDDDVIDVIDIIISIIQK